MREHDSRRPPNSQLDRVSRPARASVRCRVSRRLRDRRVARVLTPGLERAKQRRAPGTVTADVVASAALDALGHGRRTVPGWLMRVSSVLTSRSIPKRTAIALISKASSDLT